MKQVLQVEQVVVEQELVVALVVEQELQEQRTLVAVEVDLVQVIQGLQEPVAQE